MHKPGVLGLIPGGCFYFHLKISNILLFQCEANNQANNFISETVDCHSKVDKIVSNTYTV